MPGPVERWLETFMCTQYAELFDAYGFKTLHSVCQLQPSHLQSMGIAQAHSDIIYQNVEVLRQQGPSPYRVDSDSYVRNRMAHGMQNSAYESRDHQQMNPMNMNFNQQMSLHGAYGNQRPIMQQFPGSGPYPQNQQSAQQQQPYRMSGFKQEYPTTHFQGHNRTGSEMDFSNNCFPRQANPFSQVPGAPGVSQASMHHPHLQKNSGQNPQEVANNILHMASSSYLPNNTVQVPLSKNRSAPYHVPQRSGYYPGMSPNDSQMQQHQQQIQQMQFTYPTLSPQMHQHPSPHSAMSPVSPASATVMSSPHSIHSGPLVQCSSPASIHSPRMGCVRSPGSDHSASMMRTPEGNVQNMSNQTMSSPQRNHYAMPSPVGTSHGRMVSPVPVNQQLQVSTPSNVSNLFHQNYRDMSSMVSPSGSTSKSHYSSCSNVQPSPGAQSVQLSNMSSPYTPGSHTSPGSPNQQYTNPLYLVDHSSQADNNQQMSGAGQVNPLQSLQKLCMLPESRVVDPKSVVNDTCAPSPQNIDCSRNSNYGNDYQSAGSGGSYNSSDTMNNGSNQYGNNQGTEQPVQASDNSMRSTYNVLSNDSPLCNTTESTDALNIAKSFQSVDDVTSLKSEISDVQHNINDRNDGINNQIITNSEIPKETIEQNVFDQQEQQNEHEEQKCQPKKMKLLRATNQQTCDSLPEHESIEKEDLQINAETFTKNDDPEVTETVGTFPSIKVEKDSISELSDLPNSCVSPPNDTSKISVPSPLKNSTEEMHEALNGESKMIENFPNITEDTDLLKDSVTTKVNGEDAHLSPLSDSDENSHLSVRKDLKTYSRSDNLVRFRNRSGGSVSDGVIESDIEYDDHIGCDDIAENNVCDMEDNDNCDTIHNSDYIETVPDFAVKVSDMLSITKANEKQVISCPHWKKSKLNTLNSSDKDNNKKSEPQNGSYNKKNKNGIKRNKRKIRVVHKNVNVEDDIEMEVPSPNGDVNSICIENRDGTMFLTQGHRSLQRSRKTPLKYKDTSFFQGDFIFDDEEDVENEPKPKLSKNSNIVDVNHNTDKLDTGSKDAKGSDKKKEKENTLTSDDHLLNLSKDEKQKKDITAKTKNGKINTANSIYSGTANTDGSVNHDSNNSESNILEKPTDGNESDTVSRKRGTKAKPNAKQNATKTGDVPHAPQKSDKKGKTPVTVKPEIIPSNPQTSDIISTPVTIPKREKQNVKSLNGLQSMKETRNRTKNCKFENQNLQEEKLDKEKSELGSDCIVKVPDSDGDSEIVIIGDDSDNEEDVTASLAKSSFVKKEDSPPVESNLSKVVCDAKFTDSESEVSTCSKRVKSEHEQINLSKQSKEEMKGKSKQKSQKKNIIEKKSLKKFQFESDEEFDPNNTSLKCMNLNRTQQLLKKSPKNKKQDKASDFKGPIVRLEGKKDAPDKCVVINERIDPITSSKTKAAPQGVATRIQISHLPSDKSVLVPQACAEEGNQWLCALCGKHSSYRFLGDLFGPYTVDNSLDFDPGNLAVKPVSKKRKSDEAPHGANKPSRTSRRVGSTSKDAWEVWVHESCSVWSDGVYLIGSKIYGLQEAISFASNTPCTHCLEMGAMIGCLNKGCKEKYHYSCAVQKDCYLDEENFSLLCPKHKVKKLKPPEPSTSSPVT